MQISVRDLMSTRPVTVSESTPLAEATRIVLERALESVCVCDEGGRLLGCVSDYELLKARLLKTEPDQPVGPLVSRSLVTLTPEMKLEEVADFFRDSCHRRLAVLEHGRLIGQLHRRDVLRALVVMNRLQSDRDTVRIENAEYAPPTPVLKMQPVLRVVTASADDE